MEHKIKEVDDCKRELEIELTYEELKPYFEKGLLKYRRKIQRPGFRKGKVPMHLILQEERDLAEYQALEDIANEVFFKYIVDENIPLYGKGAINDIDYKPKEKLILKYDFEIYSPITLDGLENIELTKTSYSIDDSLVDEEINYLLLRNASFEIDGQATDENYRITINTDELDENGSPIEGKSNKDMSVFLNSDYLSKDYKNGLMGIKENEERIIDTKNDADEPVKLKIFCTKVEKIIYPEMNEEFFEKVTGKNDIKTFDEFKSFVTEYIRKFYDEESEKSLRNKAVSEAVKILNVKVPESYTEKVLNSYFESHKKEHKGHNHPINEKEFKDKHRGEAIFTGKWFALKEEILSKEKFEITDEDYLKTAQKVSAAYNIPAEKLVDVYKTNDDVKDDILAEKTVDFIISKAKITEITETKKSVKKMAEDKKDNKNKNHQTADTDTKNDNKLNEGEKS